MRKIKIGIIGAGGIASQHLGVIKDIEGMEVVGITSRTRSKAELLAKEYNITYCADDVASLMRSVKLDALMILVSEDQVFTVASSAMQYGIPLFIEKPAGLLLEESRSLAELARQHSLISMVGFNRRFYSIFHKGIEIIRKHGPLLGIAIEGHERMWRIREGKRFSEYVMQNWIFANSTHTIDLLRFFGGEPEKLYSISCKYRESRGDQFAAIMSFKNGAIGQYSSHWYSPGGWRVVLYGDGVTVEFKPLEKGFWVDKNFKQFEIEPDEQDIKYKPGFYGQMLAFGKLVRERKKEWPVFDLDDSYKTMLLAHQFSSDVLELSQKRLAQ